MKVITLAVNLSGTAHVIHQAWANAIESRIVRYLPRWMLLIARKSPLLQIICCAAYAPFLPSADVYFLDGIAATPMLFFRKPKKVICINSDTFFRDIEKKPGFLKKFYLFPLRRVDGFISTSNMMVKLASKYFSVPNEVVYPFVDMSQFGSISAPKDTHNIIAISGMDNSKASDIAVDAFEIVKKVFPDAKLLLVAEEESVHKKRSYYKKLKSLNIEIKGYCDMSKLFGSYSVLLNSSRHDSFGATIIEAMAAGLIPVITKNCGAKEIVKTIEPNFIRDVDAKDLAKGIIDVFRIKDKKKIIAKLKFASRKYTKERSCQAFKTAFAKVIHEIDNAKKTRIF